MEPWLSELERGHLDAAWDRFLDAHRRLIFAAIRHFVDDYDAVMDAFTHVCECLRADDLGRLRRYAAEPTRRARFTTWLVAVVRNLTVDWLRQRHGRRQPSAAALRLPPLQRSIHDHVIRDGRSHTEAYELIRSNGAVELTFGQFLKELAEVHRAVGPPGGRVRRYDVSSTVSEAPVEDGISRRERKELLAGALAGLTDEEQVAIDMYVVDGLPAAEVARVLGLADAKAVYNKVYRALAAVRQILQAAGIRREDL